MSISAFSSRRGQLEPVHEGLGKRPGVRVVAAGMLGDEPEQGGAPGFDDHGGVEQIMQDGEREVVHRSGRTA